MVIKDMNSKMTSEDLHRAQLRRIIRNRKIKTILELGVEAGLSTGEFLRMGCTVVSVDIIPCLDANRKYLEYKESHQWTFIQKDVFEFLNDRQVCNTYNVSGIDMIYEDITLWDGNEWGSDRAKAYELEHLPRLVELCYERLKIGGILVCPDYINVVKYRPAVRESIHSLALRWHEPFTVLPNRGGLVILKKHK